jgi:hypothetical protein
MVFAIYPGSLSLAMSGKRRPIVAKRSAGGQISSAMQLASPHSAGDTTSRSKIPNRIERHQRRSEGVQKTARVSFVLSVLQRHLETFTPVLLNHIHPHCSTIPSRTHANNMSFTSLAIVALALFFPAATLADCHKAYATCNKRSNDGDIACNCNHDKKRVSRALVKSYDGFRSD